MRDELEKILKEEFRTLALLTRDRLHLTQRVMAQKLEMSESSYSDIETGRFMCSLLTGILILQMQKDPNACLGLIQTRFEQAYEKEMQTV